MARPPCVAKRLGRPALSDPRASAARPPQGLGRCSPRRGRGVWVTRCGRLGARAPRASVAPPGGARRRSLCAPSGRRPLGAPAAPRAGGSAAPVASHGFGLTGVQTLVESNRTATRGPFARGDKTELVLGVPRLPGLHGGQMHRQSSKARQMGCSSTPPSCLPSDARLLNTHSVASWRPRS